MDKSKTGHVPIPQTLRLQDPRWLHTVYQENFPKALQHLLRNNGTEDDAKDIFQEAFLVLWQNLEAGKFKPENDDAVSGYLFQVVRNKWIDRLRADNRRPTTTLKEENFAGLAASTLNSEEENRIAEISRRFQQLGENCRQLLTRFYYRKMSMKEIAAHFGWTEATAKNNKYRCLQQLRTMIS